MNKDSNGNKSKAIDDNNNGEVCKRDDESHVSEAIFSLRYFGGQPPDAPPAAPLADLIGQCSKPYQKQLTPTDLNVNEARLCLGKDHVTNFMLPLMRKDENVKQGIPVVTYDADGNQCGMKFKKWVKSMYVLTSGWKLFCREHGLQEADDVTVWMFRHRVTAKLCFAIYY